MPTVLRVGGYRFFFYSNENDEPPHIHVVAAEHEAKVWLLSLEVAWSYGFNKRELSEIERIVRDNQTVMMQAWSEFFGKDSHRD